MTSNAFNVDFGFDLTGVEDKQKNAYKCNIQRFLSIRITERMSSIYIRVSIVIKLSKDSGELFALLLRNASLSVEGLFLSSS